MGCAVRPVRVGQQRVDALKKACLYVETLIRIDATLILCPTAPVFDAGEYNPTPLPEIPLSEPLIGYDPCNPSNRLYSLYWSTALGQDT